MGPTGNEEVPLGSQAWEREALHIPNGNGAQLEEPQGMAIPHRIEEEHELQRPAAESMIEEAATAGKVWELTQWPCNNNNNIVLPANESQVDT